ncbi:MAG: endonuclease/exonuclease/phosphatase family protein [Pirellulaceae bacterium]|jgi:endonuclease/exonuclease/phosphatase family metal-dependent hydrolase|nr:endonuclease [Planctomycetaceae bacterium]MDP6554458.1 endonuclease/exonuclease/phosphatase family protein [Pirellulaceae bacterium]MDP6718749.1 endonuclease/exonuclease/phosphatase family protein [Pirellulaceae bacterium]
MNTRSPDFRSRRTWWLSCLGLAAAVLCSSAQADEDRNELRVLCYNIHYGQGNDGRYDVQRLATVINNAKPDLVALQEVDVGVKRSNRVHQIRRLAELTGMRARFGPTQHYEGGLFGNAVLTHLPILDVVIHPLPYTESTPQRITYPRGAIAVTLRGRDGEPLRFISTHFQHNVAEDRLAEAKTINALFSQDDDMPTILAGDMNSKPNSDPIQLLLKHWSNATDEPASPTAPATQPTSRIDYIFYRPAGRLRVSLAMVIDERMASDHRPVLAVFELQR